MRVADNGAKVIASKYNNKKEDSVVKLFRKDIMEICKLDYFDEDFVHSLTLSLNKLKLDLLKLGNYYLVLNRK